MNLIGTFNYSKNEVVIHENQHWSAPAKIEECLLIDEFIILLLNADELGSGANIYCYNVSGRLLWIVTELDFLHKETYFTSIYVRGDLCFYAYNKVGIEVKLDYTNGNILSSEFIR